MLSISHVSKKISKNSPKSRFSPNSLNVQESSKLSISARSRISFKILQNNLKSDGDHEYVVWFDNSSTDEELSLPVDFQKIYVKLPK